MLSYLAISCAALLGSADAAINLSLNRTYTPPEDIVSQGRRPTSRAYTGAMNIQLVTHGSWFTTEFGWGTPEKIIPTYIDTGSGDTWIANSLWDPSTSSTFKNQSNSVTECFGSGQCIYGYGCQDTIWVGDTSVPNNNLVVDISSPDSQHALLGLDYTSYDNVPITFKKSGAIHTATYAIWSNADIKGNGSICFGGIDETKFTGSIGIVKAHDLPYYTNGNDNAAPRYWTTTLNGVYTKKSASDQAQKPVTNSSIGILLDTGTGSASLPRPWLEAIGAAWGCQWDDAYGAEMCGYVPDEGTVVFDFSGVEVEVDVGNLVTGVWSKDGSHWDYGFLFGEQTGDLTKNFIGFGNSWQHFVYITYDMDNNQIGFAKALTGEESDQKASQIQDPIQDIISTVPGAYTGSNYGTQYHMDSTISTATNYGTHSYTPTSRH